MLIARRFCGPTDSGNGGYAAGLLAAELDGTVEVTLRLPPPLERAMDVQRTEGGANLLADGHVVAEAGLTTIDLLAPPSVGLVAAAAASESFPWAGARHPFPECFVCGPARRPGDGLRLFPGAVPGRDVAAATWVPDPSLADEDGFVRREIVWAALDCPSWFGGACFSPDLGTAVLGRLAARIDIPPRVGEPLVSMGWSLGREGRKVHGASALYDGDGTQVALSKATWILRG